MKKEYIIGLAILIIIAVAFYFVRLRPIGEDYSHITSFQECIDAGFPAMESHPRQCATPDGRTFVEEIEEERNEPVDLLDPVTDFNILDNFLVSEYTKHIYPVGYGRYNVIVDVDKPIDIRVYYRYPYYKIKDNKTSSALFDINLGENQNITVELITIKDITDVNVTVGIIQEERFE